MPLITKLAARNLQGSTFSDDLKPITLYCGDNARGKTTRINALHLALAGYVPGMSSKGADIFKAFATGNPLETDAILADAGGNICSEQHRKWNEVRGSVKADAIQLGLKIEMPAVAIDADAYFGLSDKERTKFLFSRATLPAELTIPKLCNSITANLKNIKLEENTEATQQVISELTEFITSGHFASGASLTSPQDFISALSESMREKKLLADQNVRRMEKTVQGLTQVREQTQAAPADAEERYKKATADLQAANNEVARLLEVGKGIKRELDEAAKLAETAVDETEARKKLAELSAEKDRLFNLTANGADNVKEANAERTAVTELNRIGGLKNKAQDDLSRVAGELEHAEKETTCPTCGQSTVEIKKKIIAALKKELKLSKMQAVKIAADYAAADKAYINVKKELDAANARCDEFNKNSQSFRRISQEHADLQQKLSVNAAANAAVKKVSELQPKIVKARDEYNSAAQIAIEKKGIVDQTDAQYRLLLSERADAASKAKSIAEAQKARAEAAVLKETVSLVLSLQAELVQKAISTIIDACNRLCNGILTYPLVYKDGEIGLNAPLGFVTHKLMSGAERTLTRCAIGLALASDAPFKLAVIDEMGRLSARNKVKVVENIISLYRDGMIQQAVLVDLDERDYKSFTKNNTDIFGVIQV